MCIRKYRPDGSDGAPLAARSTVCRPPPRRRQTRLPKAGPASDRRTPASATAASPAISPSGHSAQRPDRPIAVADLPANSAKPTELALPDFVNGVLSFQNAASRVKDRRPRCTTTSIPVGEPAKHPRHESFSQTRLGWKAIGCGHLFREGWAPVSALSASPCWSRSRPTWR